MGVERETLDYIGIAGRLRPALREYLIWLQQGEKTTLHLDTEGVRMLEIQDVIEYVKQERES